MTEPDARRGHWGPSGLSGAGALGFVLLAVAPLLYLAVRSVKPVHSEASVERVRTPPAATISLSLWMTAIAHTGQRSIRHAISAIRSWGLEGSRGCRYDSRMLCLGLVRIRA